jgi:hypothetical protein
MKTCALDYKTTPPRARVETGGEHSGERWYSTKMSQGTLFCTTQSILFTDAAKTRNSAEGKKNTRSLKKIPTTTQQKKSNVLRQVLHGSHAHFSPTERLDGRVPGKEWEAEDKEVRGTAKKQTYKKNEVLLQWK